MGKASVTLQMVTHTLVTGKTINLKEMAFTYSKMVSVTRVSYSPGGSVVKANIFIQMEINFMGLGKAIRSLGTESTSMNVRDFFNGSNITSFLIT